MRSYRSWTGGRLLLVSLDPARVLSDFAFGVHHLQQDLAPCGDVRSLMPCSPHDRRTPLLLHHVAFLMLKYLRSYGFLFHHWSGIRMCGDHRTVSWHEHMWISSSFVRSYGLFEGPCFPSDSLFLSSCDLGFGGESKWSHAPCSGLLRSQGFYFSPFCTIAWSPSEFMRSLGSLPHLRLVQSFFRWSPSPCIHVASKVV